MPHPELTTFEKYGRFGLRQYDQVVLAAGFDSVWELGHGFWAARRKRYYCVVAPDGRRVTECVMPAYLMGYEMLDWQLQSMFVRRGSRGVAHMLAMHRGLRQYLRMPCVPRRWEAEETLPFLWERDCGEELRLPGGRQDLILYERGTWEWVPCPSVPPVICSMERPGEYRLLEPHVLLKPDTESLLWWQLRCQRRISHGILWGNDWPSPLRQTVYEGREEAWYELSLHVVLRAAGIACPPEKPLLPYDEERLPAAARAACHAHLTRYLDIPGACPSSARQLIKLAWLWAQGFVKVNLDTGWALVDVRYRAAGDFDPIRQEPTTPLELYRRYKLHRLVVELHAESGPPSADPSAR